MNDLDLPPRSPLPPEIRDRIRTRVHAETPRPRYRAPLSVAAAVAVLAAGAVVVGQLTAGTPDGYRAGTTSPTSPPSDTTVPGTDPQLTATQPDAQSGEDLDHCWAAVEASPSAGEFAPRSAWQPVFTVTRARPAETGSIVRVTAFREKRRQTGVLRDQRGQRPGLDQVDRDGVGPHFRADATGLGRRRRERLRAVPVARTDGGSDPRRRLGALRPDVHPPGHRGGRSFQPTASPAGRAVPRGGRRHE